MNMYEYAPKVEKKLEQLVLSGFLILGALLYGGSLIPQMPFPVVLQLLSFVCFVIAIIVASKLLLCNYVYRMEPREDGEYDLIIVEHCGKRVTVVCRIERSAIQEVTHITPENRRALSKQHAKKTAYRYAGVLFAPNLYLLSCEHHGEPFVLYILADERLLSMVSTL